MNRTQLSYQVLRSVGLPGLGNLEFAGECLDAVASWKRWPHERAAQWLAARARAAQDAGQSVDKWWFVNGEYRKDPRTHDSLQEKTPGDPNCRTCHGSGWAIVTRALADGVTMREFAVRCACRNRQVSAEPVATPSQIGELSHAKDMDAAVKPTANPNPNVRRDPVPNSRRRAPGTRPADERQLHKGNGQPNHQRA